MIEQGDFGKIGYPPDAEVVAGGDSGDVDDGGDVDSPQSTLDDEIAEAMKVPAYFDGSDPNHRRQVEVVQRLFAKKAEGDPRSEIDRVCDDALEQQNQKQEAQRTAAMDDFDWLVEHGFDSPFDEPPTDVPEYLGQAWKMQRLRAEGDYANLGVLMESSLTAAQREGRLPLGKAGAILEFLHVENVDPALKDRVDQIADGIIALLHDAHVPKKGKR